MADEPTRSRLGRGLASLIGDMGAETDAPPERARSQRRVPIELLHPNPRNPRRDFAGAELDELAASIKERGIIQPIAVRPVRGAADTYEIIAGERRWQAAQRAGMHEVPVVVLEVSDVEALELAIIENVQREDLNPIEEAAGYQALIDEFKYQPGRHRQDRRQKPQPCRQHAATAQTAGIRQVRASAAAKFSAGHARALIGHADPERLGARDRRARPQCPPGRRAGAGRGEAQSRASRRKGRRHGRVGKARLRCARSRGHDRSPRRWRHRAHRVSQRSISFAT